jgi:hypothetical protein
MFSDNKNLDNLPFHASITSGKPQLKITTKTAMFACELE